MIVRFIGQEMRTNSYGTFEPGKEYDVSTEVGTTLLSAPNMFVRTDVPKFEGATGSRQVIDVTGVDEGSKYLSMSMNELRSLMRERGLTVRRGARKAEYVELLEQDDMKEEDVDTETEDIQSSEG